MSLRHQRSANNATMWCESIHLLYPNANDADLPITQRIEVFHREQKFPLETEIDELVSPPSLPHLPHINMTL